MASGDDLFARARAVSIIDAVARRGGKLIRRGEQARGACVLCGAGETSKSAPFSAKVREGLWKCHGCGQGGDVIDFERLAGGHDGALSAARVLAGDAALPAAAARQERAAAPADDRPMIASEDAAQLILGEAQGAAGTIVERWLWARGLDPDALPGGVSGLRFHPECPVALWPADGAPNRRAPAMIAPIGGPDGLPWAACHITYLARDGSAKADLGQRPDGSARPARKMFGRVAGGAVWLCRTVGANPLVVGEGIESSWALGAALGAKSVAACLSLDNLQGGAARADDGALLLPVQADPARPPFLVRGTRDVVIGIDADMSPVRVKLRAGGVTRADVVMGSQARADLCAALAVQHWRRVGAAPRALRPQWGQDFNDAVMGLPNE